MAKLIGGATRQKVDLDAALESLMEKMDKLSEPSSSSMPKRLARIANSFKVSIGQDKRRKAGSQLELTAYRQYLTKARRKLKQANYRHSCLSDTSKGALTEAIQAYPEYAAQLEALRTEHAMTLKLVKTNILKHIQADKKNARHGEAYKIVKAIPTDHEITNFLQLEPIQMADYEEQSSTNLESKKSVTTTLPYAFIQKLIQENLYSDSYAKRAFALALASGRRPIELLVEGEFKKADANKVNFKGQAKKRAGVEAEQYDIYTLIPADEFLKAFAAFRELESVQALKTDFANELEKVDRHEDVNKRVGKTLSLAAKGLMKDKARVFKDSRAIYTRVCLDKFWDKTTDEDYFLRALLGHTSFKTQSHYKHFIIDYSAPADAPEPAKSEEPTKGAPSLEADSRSLKRAEKELATVSANVAEFVAANPSRSRMADFHQRVILYVAANPSDLITQSALSRAIGGNRQTIKDYLALSADAIAAYNQSKS